MRTKNSLFPAMRAIGIALVVGLAPMSLGAQQKTDPAIRIGDNDLGGVVSGATGPEAGVWVIAETTELPTAFAKIVVTDDQGRYVIPDLPQGELRCLGARLRAHQLAESCRRHRARCVDLTAVPAPNAAAAAQYYPAIYWYSMLNIPDREPVFGPEARREHAGQYQPPKRQWLNIIKTTGCIACHGIGTLGTRTIPAALGISHLRRTRGQRRIQSGQAETTMVNTISRLDPPLAFQYFGDWTDRIAKGELPFAQAVPAAGHRAQCRADPVGLEPAHGLSPRPHTDRPAQSDDQCQRQALRHDRGEHR